MIASGSMTRGDELNVDKVRVGKSRSGTKRDSHK